MYVCADCVIYQGIANKVSGESPSCASDVKRQTVDRRPAFLISVRYDPFFPLFIHRRKACFSQFTQNSVKLQGTRKANDF